MKRLLYAIICITTVSISQPATARQADLSEADRAAVLAAAMDYMDGALDADGDRMKRAIHPELTKVIVETFPQTGKSFIRKSGYTRLVEVVEAGFARLPADERDIEAEIVAAREGLACVVITSRSFYDYVQLAKLDGAWKIINVLWKSNDGSDSASAGNVAPSGEETDAIERTARDYIEGAFSGDPERMAKALSVELTKVFPVTLPQTGHTMLDKMGASMLIEGTRAKLGTLDREKWDISFTLLDVAGTIAMAEVLSSQYYDYLQLAKINGDWKIVNVLWKMNPSARG